MAGEAIDQQIATRLRWDLKIGLTADVGSMKIHDLGESNKGPRGGQLLVFRCPGCGYNHPFEINAPGGAGWSWNGSVDKPTFTPSLLCNAGSDRVCHSFVTDGKVQFLSDCWHHLAGQTVEIPDWETGGKDAGI